MKKSFFLFWGIIIAIVAFFWVYFPTLSRYRDLKMEDDRMTKEIQDLESKIESLSEERDLLKKEVEYIEKVIREELGLVRPGEIVYKFVPEESKPAGIPAAEPAVKDILPPVSNASSQARDAETLRKLKNAEDAAADYVGSPTATPLAVPEPAVAPLPPSVRQGSESPGIETVPLYPRQETR